MAAAYGGSKPTLIDRLISEPSLFSFFQAVHLLEKSQPDAVGVGHHGPPSAEAVRLGVSPELGFPKSDLAGAKVFETDGRPIYALTANFLGLHGSTSPLPGFYAEEVLFDQDADGVLGAFLDIFHHRLLSLFYRCWIRFRHHFLFKADGADDFSRAMFCLIGLGHRDLQEGAGFPAVRALRYAGTITQKPHSAAALRCMLQDFFGGVPVRIIQAMGRWLAVKPEQRSRIGVANCRLGENTALGERIYDRQSKFRVVIGPIDFESYNKFLPGGEYNVALRKLIKMFGVDILDFDTELILSSEQTSRLGLNLTGQLRLGWTTGFYSKEKTRQDVSVVFA
jgi:type VI secretion system protein ImpH